MSYPSRRRFLGGAAGLAAAVALPPSARAVAAVSRTGGPRAAATPLAGATVDLHSYGVTGYVQAAEIFDGYLGQPLATTIQKELLGYGAFPSSAAGRLAQLSPSGCQFVVSVAPSTQLAPSERTLLVKYLATLTKARISFRVVLFSEANDTAFTSQAEWQAYWSYYAPAIKAAGVSCGYNPGCNINSIARAEAFFPADPAPDELWLDYYATALREGVRIDQMVALANNAGISAGLAEWGWHAGKTNANPMTMPVWNLYCNYLAHLAAAGDLRLGAIYFDDSPGSPPINAIRSAADPRIPGIVKVAGAVRAA